MSLKVSLSAGQKLSSVDLASPYYRGYQGQIIALAPITVEWSRPSAFLPVEPATLQCTLAVAGATPQRLVALGDDIRLTVQTETRNRYSVFIGKVDSITQHPIDPESEHNYFDITAIDYKGIAARTFAGAPPWPYESWSARRARLKAIHPDLSVNRSATMYKSDWHESEIGAQGAPALDIDSMSVLELIERHALGAGDTVRAGQNGLIIDKKTNLSHTLQQQNGTLIKALTTGPQIRTNIIENIGQTVSYNSRISSITATWTVSAINTSIKREITRTWGNPNTPGQTLRLEPLAQTVYFNAAITQEKLDALPVTAFTVPDAINAFIKTALLASKPLPKLDPLIIRKKTAGPVEFEKLLASIATVGNRGSDNDNGLTIVGAPEWIAPTQGITGIKIDLSPNDEESVFTINTEPISITTGQSLIWRDWLTVMPTLLFDDTGPLTWGDMATVLEAKRIQ